MTNENNPIINKTRKFSLDIIEYCEKLDAVGKYIISKQLLRSATSIGTNVHEAQDPSSKNDFIHKMKYCGKRD
jgi:four helix bundle protein